MALGRVRTVKVEFWTDEQIVTVSRNARLLFIGMLNFADDRGVLEDRPLQIKMRIFPADVDLGPKEINALLTELQTARLVTRYEIEDHAYLYIRNFNKHQRISHPTPSILPLPPEIQGESGELRENPEDSTLEGNGKEGKGIIKGSCPSPDGPDLSEVPPETDATPYKDIAEAWNNFAPKELPRVKYPFASDRQRKIRTQWKAQPDLEYWTQLFKDLALSPFHIGVNDRKWKADIDYVFRKHVPLTEKFASERPKVMLQAKADCPDCKGIGMVFEMVEGRRVGRLCDCRKEVNK